MSGYFFVRNLGEEQQGYVLKNIHLKRFHQIIFRAPLESYKVVKVFQLKPKIRNDQLQLEAILFYCLSNISFGLIAQNNVIPLDLNSENLYLMKKDNRKLHGLIQSCGSSGFKAPETIKEYRCNHILDYWNLAVLLYEFSNLKHLFKGKTPYQVYQAILNSKVEFLQ
ncbi:unnamed protein product [Paramecium octaurelia]|uniref:Protein kinase domain-containing protein n=1 Tax=Paramecium octaurelia TaxID=43137 RepID=A0A8S1WRS0_PAROT|nr:unnamed protein product [Paramecium octaurelia]